MGWTIECLCGSKDVQITLKGRVSTHNTPEGKVCIHTKAWASQIIEQVKKKHASATVASSLPELARDGVVHGGDRPASV